MINNFAQIRQLLRFPNENSFYFLEIIKRRKENPEMESHAKLVRDYFIYSLEYFDKISPDIINLCEVHNARAYFRLNLRDAEKIAFQFNKRLSELLITKEYKSIPKSYASVVGEFHNDPEKKWLIDIDYVDGLDIQQVKDTINMLPPDKSAPHVITTIPTVNGVHLITRPFRLDIFKNVHPNVDVHKDNPTILYQP